MIRAVIDTNMLPRNVAAPSAAFKRIMSLIVENVITISMPHIIAEEWRTQQSEHLRKQFQKANDAIKDVLGGGHVVGHAELPALSAASEAINRFADDADAISRQALENLLRQLQTESIPISNTHGARVVSAYFSGSPPFSSRKSREDFPDAFLHETLVDLIAAHPDDTFLVVTADKNLAKHLSQLPRMSCVESLEQLVESRQVRELTQAIELETRWRERLTDVKATLTRDEERFLGARFVNSFIDKTAGKTVEHRSIPSDNNDATVTMVDDPANIEIQWDESEDYGPGALRVPFSCTSELLLDFYVFYADAYSLEDSISIQWADHERKPFFDAQASARASIKGFLSVVVRDWAAALIPDNVEIVVDEVEEIELIEDDYGNALS